MEFVLYHNPMQGIAGEYGTVSEYFEPLNAKELENLTIGQCVWVDKEEVGHVCDGFFKVTIKNIDKNRKLCTYESEFVGGMFSQTGGRVFKLKDGKTLDEIVAKLGMGCIRAPLSLE
jgi:hypothetical protein